MVTRFGAAAFPVANHACGLQPVAFRHVAVHQHDVGPIGEHRIDRLESGGGGDHPVTPRFDQRRDEQLDRFRVFGDDDVQAPGVLQANLARRRLAIAADGGRFGAHRKFGVESERGARCCSRCQLQFTPHHVHEASGDRQAEASATVAPGRRTVGLRERLEDGRPPVGCDAHPGVGHVELDADGVCGSGDAADADAHRTAFGELDGVADQVDEHLLEAAGVADQGQRHIAVDAAAIRQPLLLAAMASAARPLSSV